MVIQQERSTIVPNIVPKSLVPVSYARRFTQPGQPPLTQEQVESLQESDFIDYLREKLWDKMAQEKYGKPFDQLEYTEKVCADLMAIIEIAKAQHELERGN